MPVNRVTAFLVPARTRMGRIAPRERDWYWGRGFLCGLMYGLGIAAIVLITKGW
jgi:hypothetical protein